jgi:hypothetical protein
MLVGTVLKGLGPHLPMQRCVLLGLAHVVICAAWSVLFVT